MLLEKPQKTLLVSLPVKGECQMVDTLCRKAFNEELTVSHCCTRNSKLEFFTLYFYMQSSQKLACSPLKQPRHNKPLISWLVSLPGYRPEPPSVLCSSNQEHSSRPITWSMDWVIGQQMACPRIWVHQDVDVVISDSSRRLTAARIASTISAGSPLPVHAVRRCCQLAWYRNTLKWWTRTYIKIQ